MIKAITGTKDILPSDITKWKFVESIIDRTMEGFNYKEIRTPVFEETALFSRGIGEATDIVSKEMYTFPDKGGTSLTLRPEMTASVVRAFIEHSLSARQNLNKLFYIAPMFRQERPQAGRLRQFHQFGAEAIGSTAPALDAEIIIIAYSILKELGLKNMSVKINSLGVPESREHYKSVLKDFLEDKVAHLSEDSRKRFNTNILRIFDSKEENDQHIMEQAPLLIDYLDEESREHFNQVKELLDKAGIPYVVDPRLVRGLDYYTKTTFEIISGSVGSQSALCGGGRYDLLVEQLGGKPTPGVGFAAGIERILLACENENSLNIPEENLDLYIVRMDNDLLPRVFEMGLNFRRNNIKVEFDYLQRSMKAQMREANKLNAKYVIFLGGDEFKNGQVVLKNMHDSTQENIALENMEYISNKLAGK
ncbi:MAG: histidine--tRNA ligase [Ignavibacteriales bacterium]